MSEKNSMLSSYSEKELENLAEWFEMHGPIPIVIGGWAVFYYNPYYGSVDIDLVGPSMRGNFIYIITRFEEHYNYEEYYLDSFGLTRSWRKSIKKDSDVIGYIIIDVCTYEENKGEFMEDSTKLLPFELCEKYKNEVELKNKKKIFIPKKELLLLYKLKAFRDRQYFLSLNKGSLSQENITWYEGKIIKDGSDVLALLDPNDYSGLIPSCVIDYEIIRNIINEFSLVFILKSLNDIINTDRCLNLYRNINYNEAKIWINNLTQKLEI
ncbi:hypothetical protein JW865_09630 [Candidatus Bathyarchaeota archaeon]|nr:hypothetical protein [Candidatus Bathyarchaeota archaeon]